MTSNRSRKLTDGGFCLVEGVVGRADERAGLDVFEAHPLAKGFIFGEFVRVNKTDYRKMFASRLQILAKCQNIRALCGEILHRGENFTFFFP